MRMTSRATAALLGVAGLALGGCQSLQSSDNFLGLITPYRVEVVQGNVITKEQIEAVRPGITRAQVKDVLGTPLLADAFHTDRWDYVFSIRRQGAEPQDRRIVLMFESDRLKTIEGGDNLPSEREFVNSIDTFKTSRNAKPLAMAPEDVARLPKPVAPPPAPDAAASAPTRTYPPLEAR